ncbi:hypothetical protein [Hylemonella gracilis]|nr:hypothetical protein [Hylemonella gracilis]
MNSPPHHSAQQAQAQLGDRMMLCANVASALAARSLQVHPI